MQGGRRGVSSGGWPEQLQLAPPPPQVLAVVGSTGSGWLVQFYSCQGDHLHTMRVPGPGVSGATWEAGSQRLALAAGGAILLAAVRQVQGAGWQGLLLGGAGVRSRFSRLAGSGRTRCAKGKPPAACTRASQTCRNTNGAAAAAPSCMRTAPVGVPIAV